MSATKAKVDPATITVHNPADGRVVGVAPIQSSETVAAKARELRLFQPEWEAMGPRGRKRWLLAFQDWILDNSERIIDIVQSETGKTRGDASGEPPTTASLLNYWAGRAERFLTTSIRGRRARWRRPRG